MAQAKSSPDMTASEYLERERLASEKHIFWDGETFAMAGASIVHNRLVAAVLRDLGASLRGKPCSPYGSDQRIRIAAQNRYVYPDASVTCLPIETDPADLDSITNPTLIVEVLSDSTEAFDRGEKFVGYRSITSLRDYLLISQHTPRVEHFSRQQSTGDEHWVLRTYSTGKTIELAAFGFSLSVNDLYNGVLPASMT